MSRVILFKLLLASTATQSTGPTLDGATTSTGHHGKERLSKGDSLPSNPAAQHQTERVLCVRQEKP
jgi:hypothetical protein